MGASGSERRFFLLIWVLPILVLGLSGTGALFLGTRGTTLAEGLVRSQCTSAAIHVSMRVEALLRERVNVLGFLAARWISYRRENQESSFLKDATRAVSRVEGFHLITYVDRNSILRLAAPPDRQPEIVGTDLRTMPGREELHGRVWTTGAPLISPPLTLTTGKLAILIFYPINAEFGDAGTMQGIISGVVHVEDLMRMSTAGFPAGQFRSQVSTEGIHLFGDTTIPPPAWLRGVAASEYLGFRWRIDTWPEPGSVLARLPRQNRWLVYLALALTVISAVLSGLAAAAFIRARLSAGRLRLSEERYRRFTEHARDLIFRMSLPEGRFEYVSPAALRLTGYASEEFQNAPQDIRRLVHPAWTGYFEENWAKLVQGQVPDTLEYQLLHKDGSLRWMHQRNVLVRDDEGRPLALEAIIIDISDLKRTEEQKRTLAQQVQQIQKLESLGVLAGGIAHDFNNILMSILGHADLVGRSLPLADPACSNLKEIEEATRNAAVLCKQLLAYSGRGSFIVDRVDLNDIIRGMTHLMEAAISKKAVLHFNLADRLSRVEADAAQMRQILMNLILNASEAMEEKGGTITLRTGTMNCDLPYLRQTLFSEGLPEGSYIHFEVTDTGSGMDAQTQTRIFDPFFTTKSTGRGLGLAAVLGIVRGHRGAIKVYSEVGKGTTFKILLPAVEGDGEEPASRLAQARSWKGSGTVFLVDDDSKVLRTAGLMLRRLGFEVLTARRGREALEAFAAQEESIVCVLLDLTLPDMEAEEIFSAIRRRRREMPVIVSSGFQEAEVTRRFAGKGISGFIQKPFQDDELIEVLRRAVEG